MEMQSLIKIILLNILISCSALAANPKEATHKLISHCENTKSKAWLDQYSKVEDQWLGQPDDAKTPIEEEIIFPQYLPVEYPMRGGYTRCFMKFEKMKTASAKSDFPQARDHFVSCMSDNYREDPPKILVTYLSCLNKIVE